MPKNLSLILSAMSFLMVVSTVSAEEVSTSPMVKLYGAGRATTPQGQSIYKFKFNYESDGKAPIYIKGIGSIPPKGDLAFWSFDSKVEFSEAPAGPIIKTLSLPEGLKIYNTTHVKDLPTLNLPAENVFPQASQSYPWPASHTFVPSAMKLLGKKNMQYVPYQMDKLHYIRSTYTSLENVPNYLRVQLAVLLSHPHISGEKTYFKIQFALRERRSKESSWNETASEAAQKAATEFIEDFVKELSEKEGKQK